MGCVHKSLSNIRIKIIFCIYTPYKTLFPVRMTELKERDFCDDAVNFKLRISSSPPINFPVTLQTSDSPASNMSRPSPLAISVASIRRLLKEETTYRTELKMQESRLQRLEAEGGEGDDGNREWSVRQEVSDSILRVGWDVCLLLNRGG